MTTVLVIGATGTVGSQVMRELARRGVGARAFIRDRGAAAAILGDGVELAVGELAEPDSLRSALRGVDRVYLACGNVPGQVGLESSAIDAAARAGVKRIVKLSALGAQPGSPLAFWDWQGQIERHLAQSGVPAVVLRPAQYMTNLLASSDAIAQMGKLFAPAGGSRVAMIDPRDVAAVAAAALSEGGHEGRTYVLTGPEALTYGEIAGVLADVTGHAIEYVDVPEEAARQGMVAAGMPELVAGFLVGYFEALRAGVHATPTGTVRAVTGREPVGLAQFAREHARAFGGLALAT